MTKSEATKTLIELLKVADMRTLGEACANNPAFIEGFFNALPKEKRLITTDILPDELCGKQVRMLLGSISDRTLNRYRKKYPEMIARTPNSKSYKKSVVFQIARNKGLLD